MHQNVKMTLGVNLVKSTIDSLKTRFKNRVYSKIRPVIILNRSLDSVANITNFWSIVLPW